MRKYCAFLLLGFLAATSLAQQKSAHEYYIEAKTARSLPTLPYVCFRTSEQTSLDWTEKTYKDPTFVMLGSTKEIAEIIKSEHYKTMSSVERDQFQKFQNTDFLYVHPFDHGVAGESQVYHREDPSDPSRAGWILAGTTGSEKKAFTWEFNINWGTLRFRESIIMGSDSLNYFGSCEVVER